MTMGVAISSQALVRFTLGNVGCAPFSTIAISSIEMSSWLALGVAVFLSGIGILVWAFRIRQNEQNGPN